MNSLLLGCHPLLLEDGLCPRIGDLPIVIKNLLNVQTDAWHTRGATLMCSQKTAVAYDVLGPLLVLLDCFQNENPKILASEKCHLKFFSVH